MCCLVAAVSDEAVMVLANRKDDDGPLARATLTTLMAACHNGEKGLVAFLLHFGVCVGSRMTALAVACGALEGAGNVVVVRLLLQAGAESIPENEIKFKPECNAVLRQWHALSPARKDAVRLYGCWDYAAGWTVQQRRCSALSSHLTSGSRTVLALQGRTGLNYVMSLVIRALQKRKLEAVMAQTDSEICCPQQLAASDVAWHQGQAP